MSSDSYLYVYRYIEKKQCTKYIRYILVTYVGHTDMLPIVVIGTVRRPITGNLQNPGF